MKRLITLVTVLLIGLASVHAAQTDDQQKKEEEKSANHPGDNAGAKEGRNAN